MNLREEQATYRCDNATCGTMGLGIPVRGLGRTGAPAPIIHDFFRAPPKSVLSVAFDVSTSLSERFSASLSGGRRIAHGCICVDMDVENRRIQIQL